MLVVAKVFHKTIHAFSIGDKSGARNSLVLRKIILRAKDQEFPQGIPMNQRKTIQATNLYRISKGIDLRDLFSQNLGNFCELEECSRDDNHQTSILL
jgi:hypothetical protein